MHVSLLRPRFVTLALAAAALAVASPFAALRAAEKSTAAPVKVDGFSYVKTVGAISEYKLDSNGLAVLLLPEHSAPVVTFMVTYRVGSRNEVTGTTGATHLLEHLMFKGSDAFNRAKGTSVDQFLERVGGNYNATTYLDRTNYYAEIGNEHLEGYIAIEADRMRNLWLREEDRKPEMTVVRNEFEIGENDPEQALDKEITAAAFQAHPYHHSTIGWRSDIEKVSIEKLREFYDTFYWPDNATVTIVGDFSPAAGLALVKKYYGAIPKSPKPIPQVYTEEPAQSGPRRVTVRRAGELGVVGIAYKTPAARHPDIPALNVLSSILSSGKTSRFYRALTDKNLTLNVSANTGYFHDPSLLNVYANLAPGATHEQVEKLLLEEIDRVKSAGVTAAEVATALGKIKAATAYKRDGYFSIAGNINEDIAAGDWTLYYTLDAAMAKVTAADVQRVARQYLDINQSVTGWFIPLAAK
jgi:zinc protease